MDVDFGVEVTGPFEGVGEVVPARTPAGLVAWTLHIGPYEALGAAHDAIHAWREAHHRTFAGTSWEIYGDPHDDPAKDEVRVVYLLAEADK
jgi:effector-binding domain-containing protein